MHCARDYIGDVRLQAAISAGALLVISCSTETRVPFRPAPVPDTGEAISTAMDAQVFADALFVVDMGIVQMDAASPEPDMGLVLMDAEPVYPDAMVFEDASAPDASAPDASAPDAGMSSPCPSLMAGDPGVWEWFPQHQTCLYSGFNELRTYSSAEQRCMDLGGFLPSAAQLDPLCVDIYFRRGALNTAGQNIWTNVWVTDRFASGRYLWGDSGFNEYNVMCDPGGSTYRCGVAQYNATCRLVPAWSPDNTPRNFACLLRIP